MTTARSSRVLRTIPILIAFCLVNFSAYAKYSGGTGEPNDPYQIATAEDLILLGGTPEDYDKLFKLMADVDLEGSSYDGALIAPDANDATSEFDGVPFTGTFDGNGFKILQVFISGNRYLGLFGQIGSGAKVENLGIIDIKLGDSGQYAGGLAGYNRGKITNCYSIIRQASGDTLSSSRGGLVGYNAEGGTIADCYSSSSIAGSRSVGGLVGTNYGRVTGCYSTGNVHGGQSIGGLVGDNKGTIRDCYSTSQFCQWIGAPPTAPPKVIWPYCFDGLVGRNSGIIVNCYSTVGSWPGSLVLINVLDPNSMWKGNVWSFTTADFLVLDDFESYNDTPAGEPGSNLIFETWFDPFDTQANGVTVGHPVPPYAEQTIVHGGSQSMPFYYDNTVANNSRARNSLTPPQDWTAKGATVLSLWFYGDPANIPGQLYVKINGVKINYDGDPEDMRRPQWHRWDIDLSAEGGDATNLGNVTGLTIGIDGLGATGILFIDDIRLYASVPTE